MTSTVTLTPDHVLTLTREVQYGWSGVPETINYAWTTNEEASCSCGLRFASRDDMRAHMLEVTS